MRSYRESLALSPMSRIFGGCSCGFDTEADRTTGHCMVHAVEARFLGTYVYVRKAQLFPYSWNAMVLPEVRWMCVPSVAGDTTYPPGVSGAA